MLVTNACLQEQIIVTRHAEQRWAERGSGHLGERLGAAVPYGGQFGNGLLLIDGDMVFATEKIPCHRRCVLTCLTQAQAIVNMQSRGAHFASPPGPAQTPPKKHTPKADPSDIAEAKAIIEAMPFLATRSDEDVAALWMEALAVREELLGCRHGGMLDNLRAMFKVFEAETGRRNEVKRARAAEQTQRRIQQETATRV